VRIRFSKAFLVTLVAVLIAATSACKSSTTKPDKKIIIPPPAKITQADNGRRISVLPDQRVEITLPGNPSTGYQWVLTDKPADLELAEAREPQFKPDTKKVGAPGMITLTYRITRSGSGTLRLAYRRPWEKGTRPVKTFAVTLVVSPTKTY